MSRVELIVDFLNKVDVFFSVFFRSFVSFRQLNYLVRLHTHIHTHILHVGVFHVFFPELQSYDITVWSVAIMVLEQHYEDVGATRTWRYYMVPDFRV